MTVQGPRDLATGQNRSLSELRAGLIQAIEGAGPESVAAFIVEPVCFAGGMVIPPEGYLEMVAAVCRHFDVLTIVDEIITGFGRSGRWFCFQHSSGFVPDIVTLGKGITSAYYPLSAVAVQAAIYASFATVGNALSKVITMAGHPVGCDIALKNIAIMERDDLVGRVARNAEALSRLGTLRDVCGVRDVRGLGHMWGIEFAGVGPDPFAARCALAEAVRSACLSKGLIILRIENVLRLNPPLTITPDEVAFVVDTVVDAVRSTAATT